MAHGAYRFADIEKRWREFWLENKTFRSLGPGDLGFDANKPKCYILDMFPYPSGAGLHIGHPKGYIATDIYSRFKRMGGFNVLHPMGFDSFGLPAEIYAVENNVHPGKITEENIGNMRSQLQFLGLSYDWDREIATSREDYFKWTQWIFLKLFDSWFDPDVEWTDEIAQEQAGKARPIETLVEAFQSGNRLLSEADQLLTPSKNQWADLDADQKQLVLNNYRLVYQNEVTVNWCPALGTVLANEEVTNEGKSERGDHPVYQRPLKQWIMRITTFGDRLIKDLHIDLPDGRGGKFSLNWPEPVKRMQENWIGRSDGAEVCFEVLKPDSDEVADKLTVFTTRPDTLFGATFMVVAPEHPLVCLGSESCLVPDAWAKGVPDAWKGDAPGLGIRASLLAYQEAAKQKDLSRSEEKDKTGLFAGFYGRNPVNGLDIPVFIADYVSMDYGSGAIMAVPAHDDRDYAFAQKYGLEIVEVVKAPEGVDEKCYTGHGISINSSGQGENPYEITGKPTPEAKTTIISALEREGIGKGTVNYRLRDWIFSRQRYWGEPFPLASNDRGYSVAVDIPVILPEMDDFRPASSNDPNAPIQPPLARANASWREVSIDGEMYEREHNVMPQWAGSCWYYLRFIDPRNKEAFCDRDGERYFMPIDLYVGGAEHAVLHLLYARFWHKALYDLGYVSTPEPFKKLFNQGMITADAFLDERGVYVDIREVGFKDGEPYHEATGKPLERSPGKMGKRYKNGLPPEEVGAEYGVDALRLYEMYMGPLEASTPWSMDGIRGMQRFLQRFWRNLIAEDGSAKLGGDMSPRLEKLMHKTILRVTDDIDQLRFNTGIAGLIELNNELVPLQNIPRELARNFLLLLAPYAPHICEEIWEIVGFGKHSLASEQWPVGDKGLAIEETVEIAVQVNGKMRARFNAPVDATREELQRLALDEENIQKHVDNKALRKVIVVPNKLVNIVV
jgi:leucyl-tRNA synthetase